MEQVYRRCCGASPHGHNRGAVRVKVTAAGKSNDHKHHRNDNDDHIDPIEFPMEDKKTENEAKEKRKWDKKRDKQMRKSSCASQFRCSRCKREPVELSNAFSVIYSSANELFHIFSLPPSLSLSLSLSRLLFLSVFLNLAPPHPPAPACVCVCVFQGQFASIIRFSATGFSAHTHSRTTRRARPRCTVKHTRKGFFLLLCFTPELSRRQN